MGPLNRILKDVYTLLLKVVQIGPSLPCCLFFYLHLKMVLANTYYRANNYLLHNEKSSSSVLSSFLESSVQKMM